MPPCVFSSPTFVRTQQHQNSYLGVKYVSLLALLDIRRRHVSALELSRIVACIANNLLSTPRSHRRPQPPAEEVCAFFNFEKIIFSPHHAAAHHRHVTTQQGYHPSYTKPLNSRYAFYYFLFNISISSLESRGSGGGAPNTVKVLWYLKQ